MAPPITAPVLEGDLLAGKYRVERVIGTGGMGIVVAARHEQLDQVVAIKFVRDDALGNEEAVQRFIREARAAAKLKSEHVARVLDVGKLDSGAPYMVMEYLEGSDLGKVISERGAMPIELAADWILQACEAVAEAHAAGIVHRDLKPENLFLTNTVGGSQKVKVLDFGVSKAMGGAHGEMSSLTRTRAMLGSPLYMAPEQMRSSRDVDSRADIWALGVVLFQLLTLRWPFEAETMPELCLKVVTEGPLSLAALRPEVPLALVETIERCLQKDPAHRFANAAELATALEPFAHPASRMVAERARQALDPRLPTTAMSGASPPLSSMQRPLPSVGTPRGGGPRATPGTSAAWGTARVTDLAPQEVRRSRAVPVALAVGLAGIAAFGAVVFFLRGSAAGGGRTGAESPSSPAPGVAPAAASALSLPLREARSALGGAGPSESTPPGLAADAGPAAVLALEPGALEPGKVSDAAGGRPLAATTPVLSTVHSVAGPSPSRVSVSSSSLHASSVGEKSGPAGSKAQDDDIPTIR